LRKPAATIDDSTINAIVDGLHSNAFSVLGVQPVGDGWVLRALVFDAESLQAVDAKTVTTIVTLSPLHEAGLFEAHLDGPIETYHLRAQRGDDVWLLEDPYRFAPILTADDEHYISEGTHQTLWRVLGAHPKTMDAVAGVAFAVWAPAAMRVSLVGDFNAWDARRHGMRPRGTSGVWEIFMPGLAEGDCYKFAVRGQDGVVTLKADPVGFGSEHPPETASIVRDISDYNWTDADWMAKRDACHKTDAPISIYEVHLPSWRRRHDEGNRSLSYHELAAELVPYVKDMGFTHIEVMPISEYPFEGSWGYQPVGLYAPTIRHGTPNEFRDFVTACHQADLGLIIDWVPGHFPTDAHGLAQFDGTHLYEHADPREGFHQDWNTLIYNYGRNEVRNFLIANALYWLKEYRIDGLRVDAVASMLYRDYSRETGEWVPNHLGGRENLEAISFLQDMNTLAYGEDASIMTIAEESTAWPGVSRPVDSGGLGFGFKWNMGWMNDTLSYMSADPIHRSYEHHKMTFGLHYAFSENFILPLSHDEVVHGKGSLLGRMPGNEWEKHANLRAYYAFMWAHPGKKLLFMGGELAQPTEWNHDDELPWGLTMDPHHSGIQTLVRDLNGIYKNLPALHQRDCRPDGFSWLIGDAADTSVYAWARFGEGTAAPIVCVFNMTPVERADWRLGVPAAGHWAEVLNTDAAPYGGGNRGNMGGVDSEPISANGHDQSIQITLPPLSGIYFQLVR